MSPEEKPKHEPKPEQGKDLYPEAYPSAPRDPRSFREALHEALLLHETSTETQTPSAPLSNIEKFRAMLAAKQNGVEIDSDTFNQARIAANRDPDAIEEE